ncbi:hypothetical protein Ancab_029202, partial [Ancistrocladus abbreviatus]
MTPASWAPSMGNSWRTTDDISDNFGRLHFLLIGCDVRNRSPETMSILGNEEAVA